MDWNDVFDDELFDDERYDYNNLENDLNNSQLFEDAFKNNTIMIVEQLELEQPIITKKLNYNAYSVEREFVNSKAYHDKFEQLPVNRDVQQKLYIQAGRLLNFVDGQAEERMLAINARTGDFLVDNFDRAGSIKGTGFNRNESRIIEECRDGIVLMHNHSLNGRPSAQDLKSYFDEERVKISLILCHDGTIYGIYDVNSRFPNIYKDYLNQAKQKTNDIDEAKRLATTQIYRLNDDLGNRHKLFTLEKI